jgi:hypothetical protein
MTRNGTIESRGQMIARRMDMRYRTVELIHNGRNMALCSDDRNVIYI